MQHRTTSQPEALSSIRLGAEAKTIRDQVSLGAELDTLQFTFHKNDNPKKWKAFYVRQSSSDHHEN